MNKNSVNNTSDFDITIIGGGAIGVSIAYKLSKSNIDVFKSFSKN